MTKRFVVEVSWRLEEPNRRLPAFKEAFWTERAAQNTADQLRVRWADRAVVTVREVEG